MIVFGPDERPLEKNKMFIFGNEPFNTLENVFRQKQLEKAVAAIILNIYDQRYKCVF